MKEKLFKTLKEKCVDTGLSDKSLQEIVTSFDGGLTEESTQEQIDEIANRLVPLAKAMQAEASRWANARKPENQKANEGGQQSFSTDKPEWFRVYQEEQEKERKEMQERIAALMNEKTAENRKSLLSKTIAEGNDVFREITLRSFSRMNFESDEEFNTYLSEVKTDVEKFKQSEANKAVAGSFVPPSTFKSENLQPSAEHQQRIERLHREQLAVPPALSGIPELNTKKA